MNLLTLADIPFFTMAGLIFALLSAILWLTVLHDRTAPADVARSKPRMVLILTVCVLFFIGAGLGLLDIPFGIGLALWAIGAFVLLDGLHLIQGQEFWSNLYLDE